MIRRCLSCKYVNRNDARYCAKCGLELWPQLVAQLEWVVRELENLTDLTVLDISGNDLINLPPEIESLVNLTVLKIQGAYLFEKFPLVIIKLSNLTSLTLSWYFPDAFRVGSRGILELPPEIGNLTNLTNLNLDNNQLTGLPPEIGNLTNLTSLNLSSNQITSLPPEIGSLTNLTNLNLSINKLTTLPPEIGNLTNLINLNLSNNPLISLPTEILQLKQLIKLNLHSYFGGEFSNQLNLPPEIIDTEDPETIFQAYFGLTQPLHEAKVLLVGQGGVGKTSLARRLLDDSFDAQESITQGVDVRAWSLPMNDHDVRLHVWDFGGQEIYHATHQFFFTHRSLYLLVLDARQGISESQTRNWLDLIRSFGGDAPVIIVVNKIDQHREPLAEYRLRADYPTIRVLYTSCRTGEGIAELRAAITQTIATLPHVDDRLPKTWYAVKERLQTLEKDVISYERYEELCAESGVADGREQKRLLRLLHDLGTVLNFQDDPRLEDTSVLNPNWVTQAVYRLLTVVNERQTGGVFHLRDLRQVLDLNLYPTHQHRFLLDLMVRFELCFPLDEQAARYLIPTLLPKEQPIAVQSWPFAESLAFAIHYRGSMPDSIFSRFMVRKYTLIEPGVYWRSGVALAYADSRALVKVDHERKRLEIWVTGPPTTRRALLMLIRGELDGIHASFAPDSLGVQEMAPLPDYPGQAIPYQQLLNLEKRGFFRHYFAEVDAEIDVLALLNGIELPLDRGLSELRRLIMRAFNLSELRALCFELGIDYEEFPATKSDFVLDFLQYVQGNGRLETLREHLQRERPYLTW